MSTSWNIYESDSVAYNYTDKTMTVISADGDLIKSLNQINPPEYKGSNLTQNATFNRTGVFVTDFLPISQLN